MTKLSLLNWIAENPRRDDEDKPGYFSRYRAYEAAYCAAEASAASRVCHFNPPPLVVMADEATGKEEDGSDPRKRGNTDGEPDIDYVRRMRIRHLGGETGDAGASSSAAAIGVSEVGPAGDAKDSMMARLVCELAEKQPIYFPGEATTPLASASNGKNTRFGATIAMAERIPVFTREDGGKSGPDDLPATEAEYRSAEANYLTANTSGGIKPNAMVLVSGAWNMTHVDENDPKKLGGSSCTRVIADAYVWKLALVSYMVFKDKKTGENVWCVMVPVNVSGKKEGGTDKRSIRFKDHYVKESNMVPLKHAAENGDRRFLGFIARIGEGYTTHADMEKIAKLECDTDPSMTAEQNRTLKLAADYIYRILEVKTSPNMEGVYDAFLGVVGWDDVPYLRSEFDAVAQCIRSGGAGSVPSSSFAPNFGVDNTTADDPRKLSMWARNGEEDDEEEDEDYYEEAEEDDDDEEDDTTSSGSESPSD
jgi:hypothetical protein